MILDAIKTDWPLDEASGTREDDWASHDLTDTTAVGSAAGLSGTAASYDGGDYLLLADHADFSPTGAFTFAMWVYPEDPSDPLGYGIFGKLGEYYAYFDHRSTLSNNLQLNWVVAGTAVNSAGYVMTKRMWQLIVVGFSPEADRMWMAINNNAKIIAGNGGTLPNTANGFRLGSAESLPSANRNYVGRMQWARFWHRELDYPDLAFLWNSGAGGLLPAAAAATVRHLSLSGVGT